MPNSGLSRRKRRSQIPGFTPAKLFASSEVGVWYDPSDLTPEKVSWRRNLLTYSEQFDNAAWVKSNATVTANAGVAPDGSTTADLLAETTASSNHFIQQQNLSVLAATYTYSLYAKRGTGATAPDWIQLAFGGFSTSFANFNLTTGLVGNTSAGITTSIESAGSGWWRIRATLTVGTAASGGVLIALTNNTDAISRNPSYVGQTTSDVFIWGAQLELGSTASTYQRITDFSSDFLAAFPTHTLYQNSTGTTPVTALGQSVGLVLDKSRFDGRGVVNLLTFSEQFDNAAWTKTGATITANSVTAPDGTTTADTFTSASEDPNIRQSATASSSTAYTGTVWLRVPSGTLSTRIQLYDNTGTTLGATLSVTLTTDWQLFSITRTTGASSTAVGIAVGGFSTLPNGTSFYIWGAQLERGSTATTYQANVASVGGPGNHARQTTDAARPTLQARSNLLTYSEQFDNAAWTKFATSVTANTTTAPDGTTSADTLTANGTSNVHRIQQSFTSGAARTFSVYAKAGTGNFIQILLDTDAAPWANFNLATGVVGSTGSNQTATIEAAGNGWYRCIVYTSSTTTNGVNVGIVSSATSVRAEINSSSDTVFIWGAQLELGSTASTYQRVVTATDYADVGGPRSLTFDGVDDSLVTAGNVNFSGTDKMTVCAGVFKGSDATFAPFVELTASAGANAGSFNMSAPATGATADLGFYSRGTGIGEVKATTFTAPYTGVMSGLGDISGDSAILRVNGTQVGSSTADQGTGTYSSALLYVGRRGGTSNPFNGRIHQLIVRGAATDSVTIQQTERFVAQKTGVVI